MSLIRLTEDSVPKNRVIIKKASDFPSQLESNVDYFIDGIVDLGARQLEVPVGGLYLSGHNFDLSRLVSSEVGYQMFTSPVGGSGNILGRDVTFTTSGSGSQVWDINGATGDEAIEFDKVNYNDCTSLGVIDNYRQYLEVGTGRFGGTPVLEFKGVWGGARISTSIVRNLSNLSALFKAGAGLTFIGRFITDINCDLPTTGALADFSESHFLNDESLVIQGAYITRNFAVNAKDAGILPNISPQSVKSNFQDNTGVGNTNKYIKVTCSAETVTTVTAADTYYQLLGTFTVDKNVHFSMPTNGQFELLTGAGDYLVSGNLSIVGTANDQLDVRVTKSTDSGATFPTTVAHIGRVVNNLSGARDVAFFPLSFVIDLEQGDRLRLEIENKSGANDVTMELESFFIVSEI